MTYLHPDMISDEMVPDFQEKLRTFKSVNDLLVNEKLTYDNVNPGDIITAQGFRYEAAAADATDHHVTNAGGVKWYVMGDTFYAIAFGLQDATVEQTVLVQRIFDIAYAEGKPLCFTRMSNDLLVGRLVLPPIRLILDEGVWFTANTTTLVSGNKLMNFNGDGLWHVTGYGAGIRMDKATFAGEQNHAWSINHQPENGVEVAGTVILEGIEGRNSGGDGFYFRCGQADVIVRDLIGVNNRRQGTSIIAVKTFTGYGGIMADTIGTAPMAGLCIEPNSTGEFLGPIVWDNLQTTDNNGAGLEINLENYQHSDRSVHITIVDWVSQRDNVLNLSGSGFIRRMGRGSNPIAGGLITFTRPVTIDCPTSGIAVIDKSKLGPRVVIDRPVVINGNLSGSTNLQASSAIALVNLTGGADAPGGVDIIHPRVEKISPTSAAAYVASVTSLTSTAWDDVDVVFDPVDAIGTFTNTRDNALLFADNTNGRVNFKYTDPVRRTIGPNPLNLTDGRFLGQILNNQGTSGGRVVFLPPATAANVGQRWEFEIRNAASLEVKPMTGETILPIGNGVGRGVVSSTSGARVTVECFGAALWMIVNMVGTWTQGA